MKTCPYCACEVEVMYCSFCDMVVVPVEDGQRSSRYKRKEMISHIDSDKSLRELMEYHTYDLLLVLKLLREERRSYFNLMRTIKQAQAEEFKEAEQESGNEYEQITRKVWAVENLLKERVGYIPKVISEKLLATYLTRMEEDEVKKYMKIGISK